MKTDIFSENYIHYLVKWVKILDDLKEEIRSTGMDEELHDEFEAISKRLMNEIGVRHYFSEMEKLNIIKEK